MKNQQNRLVWLVGQKQTMKLHNLVIHDKKTNHGSTHCI